MSIVKHATFATLLAVAQACPANTCEVDDSESKVSGVSQCLMMRRFGTTEPDEFAAAKALSVAQTGERDDNAPPALARTYVEALQARDICAQFKPLPGETHNSAFRSTEVFKALQALLR
jgi:hypothetical protein